MNTIPGITSIAFSKCSLLPMNLVVKYMAKVPVTQTLITQFYSNKTTVDFTGIPTCTVLSEEVNHVHNEKATLKFMTADDIDVTKHLAFIIRDTNGNSFLIGANEHPYPMIKKEKYTGEPDGSPAVFSYEVTYRNFISLINIV